MRRLTLAMTAWLALGIPLWFFTLNVDRAELKYDVLEQYEQLAKSTFSAGIRIAVWSEYVPDLAQATESYLNKKLAQAFETVKDPVYRPHFVVDSQCSPEAELCVHANIGATDTVELDTNKRDLSVEFSEVTLASGKVVENVSALLLDHVYHQLLVSGSLSGRGSPAVTINYTPKLHLTFSIFSESGDKVDWYARQAIEWHLGKLLKVINKEVVEIKADTQTALFARPPIEPTERKLQRKDLTNFVDFAEWPVSSVTQEPTLHFVLYVPQHELEVVDSKTNSFIIPQWGGVVISEPLGDNAVVSSHELEQTMFVFAHQLLALLGMREPEEGESADSKPPLDVRLADLGRRNSIRGLQAAAASIGSLQRLAASMPAIPIPQQVRIKVDAAINAIDRGLQALDAADLEAAAAFAREAYVAAEQAFFNKDMVAQAYFPDEHKLAVYMPLIGPLVVVVFSGWLRLVKGGNKPKVE